LTKSKNSITLWTINSNSGTNTLFTGDPEEYVKGRLWKWASLSIGAPLGNLEVGSFTRDFETVKEHSVNGVSLSLFLSMGPL
jgi:hypothetical protein